MPKVSIIITIYNSEKVLERCIDSILNQSFENFELILVNDGSKDSSKIICYKYKDIDKRVRVINKTNGGVSSARNIGVKNARGTYIMFVDSDDYCEVNMLKDMLSISKNETCDLITCGYRICKNKKKILRNVYAENLYSNNTKEIGLFLLNNVNTAYCVAKLFKLDIIRKNNITFNERFSLAEDSLFVLSYMMNIKSISISKEAYYNYVFCNSSSLSTKYVKNISEIYEEIFENEKSFSNVFGVGNLNKSKEAFLAPICIYNNYKKGCELTYIEKVNFIKKYMLNDSLYIEIKKMKSKDKYEKLFKILFCIRSANIMNAIYSLRLLKVKFEDFLYMQF